MPHKIFFCFLLLISLTFGANDDAREIGKAVSDIEHLQKNYEKLDGKIDEMEKNQKSVEEYRNIIDRQDKRIDEITIGFAALSIFIALAAIAASLFGVSKVRRDAKEATEKWLEDNAAKKIKSKLKALDNILDEKINNIERQATSRLQNTLDDLENAKELLNSVSNMRDDIRDDMQKIDNLKASNEAINAALEYAIHRAETSNSFHDWYDAAMFAYKQKQYKQAINFWEKASMYTSADNEKAKCLYNKAVMLNLLREDEKAIELYDELNENFKNSTDNKTLAQVVQGLFNKSLLLGKAGRSADEIMTYSEIYKKYKDNKSEDITVQVAKALFAKGIVLGQQGKTEEAIKTYNKVYEEFGTSQNEEIRVRVTKALYNKGIVLGQQGDNEEAIKTYDKAYEEFGTSQNEEIRVYVAAALVSKGIVLLRQGIAEKAKEQYLKSIEFNPSYLDAYTNLFEIWLIMGDEFDEKIVSQFLELGNARENKQELLLYEMIAALKASLVSNQSAKIKELKDKYSGVGFGDWSWKELEAWAQDMTDVVARARVLEAISEFKLF